MAALGTNGGPSSFQTIPDETQKRQRVSVACLACRAKRMRCDGAHPICRSCIIRGVECQYQAGENKRKPPSKRYVESLQSRIKLLEDQLKALGKPISATSKDQQDVSDDDDYESIVREGSSATQQRDPIEEATSTMGRLNVGEDGQLRFFGSQSNFHLLHGHMGDVTPNVCGSAQERRLDAVSKLGKDTTISEELQEHLLDLYWRWQNPWVYIVHKAFFLEDLRSYPRGKYCTPLLLSAIFALASRYSDRTEVRADPMDPSTAGAAFAEQASILLLNESEAATTTTVQATALLSLRAMSEDKEAMGWLYSGMATRMAFNLGLNLDCSRWVAEGLISEKDFEVRKVAWWGSYTLDKLFAMALGRPGTTRGCDITCPKSTLSQDAEFEAWVPVSANDEALLGAYTRNVSTSYYICENLVIATEALDQIIQYHVTQILLHRPLISRRRAGSGLLSTSSSETNLHMQTCRHSAAEVARLLRAYQHHYTLRLIPLVSVHNAFTAAITHLIDATSTVPSIRRQGIRYLGICVKALQEMSTAWSWSARALRGLKLLAQEWMSADAIEENPKPKSPTEEPAAMAIPVPCPAPQNDEPRTLYSTVSNNGSAGIGGLSPSSGKLLATDDIGWLFVNNPPIDFDGMDRMDAQAQRDMWLLDAAQNTFTSYGWDGDPLLNDEYQHGSF